MAGSSTRPNATRTSPGRPAGKVGLYAIHIEGADMEFYGASKDERIQQMPCATERRLGGLRGIGPGHRRRRRPAGLRRWNTART